MTYNAGDGSYSASIDPDGTGEMVNIQFIPASSDGSGITITYSTNPDILSGLGNPDAMGAYISFSAENSALLTGVVQLYIQLPNIPNDIWYHKNGSWAVVSAASMELISPPQPDYTYHVTLDLGDKGRGETLEIVSDKGGDDTLPIHLSHFSVTLGSDMFVALRWTVETESNQSGYNILRSEIRDISQAIKINPELISDGVTLGTSVTYTFSDQEVSLHQTYYYWLESICTNGISSFAGPLIITIGDHDVPDIPGITIPTRLHYAFPNPFNPNTNLRYSVKEPATVNISIHNLKGQLIRNWEVTHPQKGYYQISWDGKDYNGNLVGGGVYPYKMDCGSYHSSKKVVLMK